jgi:hypothetical protein
MFQLRQYVLRQLFAQFHSPLIEAEDVPNHTLREDLVLIYRYKASQRARRELFEED